MIPNDVLRAVAARMRELDHADGPKLADLTDLHPFTEEDVEAINVIANEVLWLKDNGWGQR